MLIDGGFLALVGTAQMTLELVGHHLGAGPFGPVFDHSPYTIGWVEAHGLAALIGVLFLVAGGRERRPLWHGFALAVHLLLGGANLHVLVQLRHVRDRAARHARPPRSISGSLSAQAWCLIVSRSGRRS